MRQQPKVSSSFDEDQEADPDQERIEIPAFLRRQAN
jgi:cell division protein FtsZ